MTSSPRGTLFLVAGPSGAGKDTLIAAARGRLKTTHAFPARVITRPGDDTSEAHVPASTAAFEAAAARGQFALRWQAHGTWYGIPAGIGDQLASGQHVVVNVSRTVVPEARARFSPTRCILVTASPGQLSSRLAARGREGAAAIAGRLEREIDVSPDHVISNDGPLESAVEAFITALTC
jgi:ribose 1,5-bisphosphokinase